MNAATWSSVSASVAAAAAAPPLARAALPAAPRRIRLGMPHLDAGGLSEGWLLREAGDLHWEAIGARLGVATDQIRSDAGERLYPTVVALCARYDAPLAAVRENQVLNLSAEVVPCGRACAHGRMVAIIGGERTRFSLELLTSFAARAADGTLRTTVPAPRLARHWGPVGTEPALAGIARAARRGELVADPFAGPALEHTGPALAEIDYEPSPYADYNGAGLLYFAAYVTISDSLERRMVRRLGLDQEIGGPGATGPRDWAHLTSTVRRDVFYYDNLPLGAELRAALLSFTRDRRGVTTRVRLTRADMSGGPEARRPMADVVTRRVFVGEGATP
jgi:probable biosynthetic protein (TIGR04098 family)